MNEGNVLFPQDTLDCSRELAVKSTRALKDLGPQSAGASFFRNFGVRQVLVSKDTNDRLTAESLLGNGEV
jgi:hypothetical protein